MSGFSDPSNDPPDEEDFSLGELSRAYADAIRGQGTEADAPQPDSLPDATAEDVDPEPDDGPPEPSEVEALLSDDDPCPISPATILEAMLFVGDRHNQPLAPGRAAELMRGVECDEIPQLVEHLNSRYAANGCPYRIQSAGAGYKLVLRGGYNSVRNRLYGRAREAQLSQAAVDVLAILAYRQPLTGEEVSRLRGTPSSHVLAQLVRRQLLRIERQSGKRRSARYFTTDRFLELFNLESLDELPQAEDIEPR